MEAWAAVPVKDQRKRQPEPVEPVAEVGQPRRKTEGKLQSIFKLGLTKSKKDLPLERNQPAEVVGKERPDPGLDASLSEDFELDGDGYRVRKDPSRPLQAPLEGHDSDSDGEQEVRQRRLDIKINPVPSSVSTTQVSQQTQPPPQPEGQQPLSQAQPSEPIPPPAPVEDNSLREMLQKIAVFQILPPCHLFLCPL